MVQRTCETCSSPFEGRSKQAKFCSRQCRWTASNQKRYKRPARSCPGCAVDLSEMHGRVKYCSEACRRWVANGHVDLRRSQERCKQCKKSLPPGKRAHAVYCNKSCKKRAYEKRNSVDAARYIKEREKRIAYALNYARSKPEVGQATKNRRKARKRDAGVFQVSGADWRRLCARYRFCCAYCGQQRGLTMDHVIPISRGGRHSIGNLLPACASCNSSKSSSLITEWRARA